MNTSKNALPKKINPIRLADESVRLSGALPIHQM